MQLESLIVKYHTNIRVKLAVAMLIIAICGLILMYRLREAAPIVAVMEAETAWLDKWRDMDYAPFDGKTPRIQTEILIPKDADRKLRRILIRHEGDKPIHNFWLHPKGTPDFHTATTLMESAIAKAQTDAEKVEAIFNLFDRYHGHAPPPSGDGALCNPSSLLSVFGMGQCSDASFVCEALLQMAGLETRGLGLGHENGFAHKTFEVRIDDGGTPRWVFVDPDGKILVKDGDGRLLGIDELRKAPDLIRNWERPTFYNLEKYAQVFENGNIQQFPYRKKAPFAALLHKSPPPLFNHIMRFDLHPGSKIVFERTSQGEFFHRWKGEAPLNNLPPYANGTLTIPLNAATGHLDKRTGRLIVPVRFPYLFVRGKLEGTVAAGRTMSVYYYPLYRGIFDKGNWILLGTVAGKFDLDFSKVFEKKPTFGYALKLDYDAGSTLTVSNIFQHNPRATFDRTDGAGMAWRFYHNGDGPKLRKADKAGAMVTMPQGLEIEFVYSAK
jgi:hypothetical protein